MKIPDCLLCNNPDIVLLNHIPMPKTDRIYKKNMLYLQIKIHITLIDDILFNSDVTEGDGGI